MHEQHVDGRRLCQSQTPNPSRRSLYLQKSDDSSRWKDLHSLKANSSSETSGDRFRCMEEARQGKTKSVYHLCGCSSRQSSLSSSTLGHEEGQSLLPGVPGAGWALCRVQLNKPFRCHVWLGPHLSHQDRAKADVRGCGQQWSWGFEWEKMLEHEFFKARTFFFLYICTVQKTTTPDCKIQAIV